MVKYTKTATFLFPLLKIPKSLFLCEVRTPTGYLKFTDRFLNAYIGDKSITKYENGYVFLLLRNYRDVAFDEFYQQLIKLENYVEDYEVNNCMIAIFSIPEEFKEDYNRIIEGKYSKVNREAREVIIQNCYHNFNIDVRDALNMIFERASSLQMYWEQKVNEDRSKQFYSFEDREVCSKIDEKDILCKETYNKYSKVTNYNKKGKVT